MKALVPVLFALSASSASFAQGLVQESELERSYQLCSSWSFSSEASGYVCSFLEYVNVLDDYERREMEQTIYNLQYALQALEYRVQALESGR